jgi:hypothetical protein
MDRSVGFFNNGVHDRSDEAQQLYPVSGDRMPPGFSRIDKPDIELIFLHHRLPEHFLDFVFRVAAGDIKPREIP